MIEVIRPGSRVTIGGDIGALVLAVMLMTDGLQYKVAWWDGGERKEEWLDPAEIGTAGDGAKVAVGFARDGSR